MKNICRFEMGGGGVWQMLTSSGGGGRSMLTVADRGRGGKICQNLADVICERSLIAAKGTINVAFKITTQNFWTEQTIRCVVILNATFIQTFIKTQRLKHQNAALLLQNVKINDAFKITTQNFFS